MRRRWFRWVLLCLAIVTVGSFGLSTALQGGWARRLLLARLSAGFGRPVEVGRFGFSLLSGVRLKARSVTVYDDPRFGQEYFVRAEELTVGVRWLAMLRGRFEFDTVSLTRPSLNLVRLSDGQWNIESWLPPLPGAGRVDSSGAAPTARLSRVEIEDGRINFKRDSRKLPLALVAVNGQLDHEASGDWNIDVQANPMRAPASLQQAGTFRVRGTMGGVSTRLRPARLSLTWQDASLADLSRLAQGGDLGLRGTFNAEWTARIEESPAPEISWGEWLVDGTIRLRGVHGWALAARDTDPGANISFQAKWRPGDYRLLITQSVIEAPHSHLEATADLDWSRGFHPSAQISSARLGLADLLAWHRAFRATVSEDLAVDGTFEAQGALSGWPVRVDDLVLTSAGATIRSPALPGPIRIGPVATAWRNDTLRLLPVQVALPAAVSDRADTSTKAGAAASALASPSPLMVEASIGPLPVITALPEAHYRLAVSGSAHRAQDLLAVARAWGWSSRSSWTAEGPVSLRLAWSGSLRSGTSPATGTIQARGVRLATPLLNRPVLLSAATIDLRGNERRVNLRDVEALGAHWTGLLRGPGEDGGWSFDLAADRLDTGDFYAWLGEPARPSLLQRMLPFGGSSSASEIRKDRANALQEMHARGRLRVTALAFSPLQVERIDAATVIDGPSLTLHQGRANLAGGQITGDLAVRLSDEPSYSFDGQFARVDLSDFAESVALPGRLEGLASGELEISARGADRAALAASLQGDGRLRARETSLGQFALAPVISETPIDSISNIEPRRFALTTSFHLGDGRVRLDEFLLARPGERTEVTGTVDFAGRLDLHVQSSPRRTASLAQAGSVPAIDLWTIAGTLDSPHVVSVPAPANPAGVPSASR
jgi:hypothetical protein